MCSDVAIRALGLGKSYQLYNRPADRLKQLLWRGQRQYYREFHALQNINLEIRRGEVVGIVGRNGAGKSTLLQLICGTLTPTAGQIEVDGRIAALLELGAGFNPEFTGRENIHMNASILGLSPQEIEARYDDIVAFSGIGSFINQPVKTYSSGMYVRLAFAVATSIEPDILVIDEALSVGDGAFARKSFERIMALKDAGKTILFCSHSMYQIEALCNHVFWLDAGKVRLSGQAREVTRAYSAELDAEKLAKSHSPADPPLPSTQGKPAAIDAVEVCVNGRIIPPDERLTIYSQCDDFAVDIIFHIDLGLPLPNLGIVIATESMIGIVSANSLDDRFAVSVDLQGRGHCRVCFPKLALLQGNYTLSAFLGCERALHLYDAAEHVRRFHVMQEGLTQGVVALPHYWQEIGLDKTTNTVIAPSNSHDTATHELENLGFTTASDDVQVLTTNLLASPCLANGIYPIRIASGVTSAAAAINTLLDAPSFCRWLICVHQGVFLPPGWDAKFLEGIAAAEAQWGRVDVAGVDGLGIGAAGSFIRAGKLLDRDRWLDKPITLPCLALSLNELLFAVRTDSSLRLDPQLGFNFYATDLVLSAHTQGLKAVIVSAPCEYSASTPRLVPPTTMLEHTEKNRRYFLSKWCNHLPIHTPCLALDREEDLVRIIDSYRNSVMGADNLQ